MLITVLVLNIALGVALGKIVHAIIVHVKDKVVAAAVTTDKTTAV